MKLNCPHCDTIFDVDGEPSTNEVKCPSCFTIVSMIELLTVSISPKEDDDSFIGDEEAFFPGDSLSHFQLIRQLGQGGFGTVFEAHDRRLERRVAVKVPRVSQLSERQAHVFIREARAAAQLNDPNIVSVFEVGRAGNRIFIVSELIDGMTLGQWAQKTKPDQYVAAALVSKLAKSIHHAHQAGIIHRDLKPSNVLVDENDAAHITDFGLAKRFDSQEETRFHASSVMGTPAYMPPEQAAGNSDTADCRSDVYSVGVMLYELLTTVLPFTKSGDRDIFENIKQGHFRSPREQNPGIRVDLEAICLTAMALDPADRYASALDFANDLDRFLDHRPVKARRASWFEHATYFIRRNQISVGATALILVLIVLNINSLLRPNPDPELRVSPLPVNLIDVEFSVKPEDSKVSMVRIDFDLGRADFSEVFRPTKLDHPEGRKIRLRPGTYLIQTESILGVHEVYRVVPESTDERVLNGFRMTSWKTKGDDTDCVVWQSIEAKQAIELESAIFQAGPEKLIKTKPGAFETGTESARRMNKQGRLESRVPRQLVSMPSYLIGQTEVTARNFYQVMGKYPAGMRIDGAPGPTDVATNVTWLEAIEYCERIGVRLPTYDEYLFVATNRGSTRYPFGDQFDFQDWKIGIIKEPELDKTETSPFVYNLYSSVGEWAWDINLSTDSQSKSQLPDQRLLAMWEGRMLLGIAPGAPQEPRFMPDGKTPFGPADFVDKSLYSAMIQDGFRVCKGLSKRFEDEDQAW